MKKIRPFASILLAAALSVSGSMVAFADPAGSTAQTPRAAEKLVEYLTTLSPEEVITTLQDKDYLNMLLMDYYWEPYEQADPQTRVAQSSKLDAPATQEDLMTFAGLTFEKTIENGELTYNIEGSDEAMAIYDAAVEENNRRIQTLWEENALSRFAEDKKLDIEFDYSSYGIVQFRCTLSKLTVEELADKLNAQPSKAVDADHRHDWMYFDVTDKQGDSVLLRCCQSCEKWQVFYTENTSQKQPSTLPQTLSKSK